MSLSPPQPADDAPALRLDSHRPGSVSRTESGSPEPDPAESGSPDLVPGSEGAESYNRQRLAAAYAACALSTGASLAFFVTGVAPLPVLLYFPLGRRFGFQTRLGELSMDYYGRSLVALLAGAVLALLVYLMCSAGSDRSPDGAGHEPAKRSEPRLRDRLALCAAYAVTAAVLAAGLFAYQLAARVPTPEPFPTAVQAPRI